MPGLERSSPSSADACGRTATPRDLRRNNLRHLVEILRGLRAGGFAGRGGAVGAWIVRETFARLPYP